MLTHSVPPVTIGRVVQYAESIIVGLSVMPGSERTVTLVWPPIAILEQPDPKRGPVSIKDLLQGAVLGLAPHPGQVLTAVTTVSLGLPPDQLGKNDVVGAIICSESQTRLSRHWHGPLPTRSKPDSAWKRWIESKKCGTHHSGKQRAALCHRRPRATSHHPSWRRRFEKQRANWPS